MKFTLLIITLLTVVLNVPGYSEDTPLQLIKTVGEDERDDYIIFGLADAILTDKKDIFILNAKGNFVAKYNWKGEFIDRVGQRGRGPQDFYFPRSLAYSSNSIYVLDRGNHRIVEMNLNSEEFKYYKEDPKNQFMGKIAVLNSNMYLGVFSQIDSKRGRIGIIDTKGNVVKSFFNHSPVDIAPPKDSQESIEQIARKVIASSMLMPVFHFDEKKDEMLISFLIPDNPISFFVYNTNGKELRSFSYIINDKRYRFPLYVFEYSLDKLRDPIKYPERFEPQIDSVFIYRENYIAFLNLTHYVKAKEVGNNRRLCLIFSRDGHLRKSFEIEKDLRIFRLSRGYFLGTRTDEEIEKLYIFELKLK